MRAIVQGALDAVSPRAVIAAAYRDAAPAPQAALTVLIVGKAASAMAAALRQVHQGPLAGLVVGTHGGAPPPLCWQQGAHPVPDARSQAAAAAALTLARGVAPGDGLLVMVSGGASALLALPVEGVTLADKQETTRRLLAEGAEIGALNAVRKHLSAIKGGRLAQACPGRVDAWLLSDVVGDDPAVIGSGPTVPDPTTFRDAIEVLEAHGGRASFPPSAVAHLERGVAGALAETPKTAADLPRARARVIAGQAQALDGARRVAEQLGYQVVRRPAPVVGQAREAAWQHYDWLRGAAASVQRPVCVLSGGETTVRVTGAGRGGRNQEFALALAPRLAGGPWLVASVGTDGVDGPTDAAGAWVDGSTAARAAAAGLDPMTYLDANDAWSFFTRVGGLIVSGPTDTNVGDLQVALIGPPADPGETSHAT